MIATKKNCKKLDVSQYHFFSKEMAITAPRLRSSKVGIAKMCFMLGSCRLIFKRSHSSDLSKIGSIEGIYLLSFDVF